MNTTTQQTLMAAIVLCAVCALGSTRASAAEATTNTTTTTTEKTASTTDMGVKLTDAHIASIVQTADEAEIKAAKLAEKKSTNSDIKGFAKYMINEHSENKKDSKKLDKKISIQARNNGVSKTLNKEADAKMKDLKSKTGADFDKAYIALQVEMHEQLLGDLDNKFIPNTQNAEMKSFLENTKTHVAEHLARAKKIQASLGE